MPLLIVFVKLSWQHKCINRATEGERNRQTGKVQPGCTYIVFGVVVDDLVELRVKEKEREGEGEMGKDEFRWPVAPPQKKPSRNIKVHGVGETSPQRFNLDVQTLTLDVQAKTSPKVILEIQTQFHSWSRASYWKKKNHFQMNKIKNPLHFIFESK